MTNAIDYTTNYQHTTHTIIYQLVFSTRQMKFIRPSWTERGVAGHLHYRLLPGHYLKFSMLIRRTEVTFRIMTVDIVDSSNIVENEVVSETFDWEYLEKIQQDPNAPKPFIDFVKMMPGYHGAPRVDDTTKYDMYKSSMEMVRTIRDYLQGVLVNE